VKTLASSLREQAVESSFAIAPGTAATVEPTVQIAEHPTRTLRLLRWLHLEPALAGYALGVFLVSRVVFIGVTLAATHLLHPIPYGAPVPSFLAAWSRWDAAWYVGIATYGYASLQSTAFFPLLPLLMHGVAPLVGGNVYVAGMVVANVSYLVALVGIGVLVPQRYDVATARRTMLYLTCFPTGFFFFAAYTESLFLALTIWCVLALRRGAWWQAGALGLLASLTRQMGVFLALPFAYYYLRSVQWQWRQVRWSALAGGLIPAGLALFMLWLWHAVGDPLAFAHVEQSWQHVALPPWETLWRAVGALLHNPDPIGLRKGLVDLGAVVLIAALLIRGARQIPPGELAYTIAVWLLVVAFPTLAWWLQSDARYMLAAFPCFIVLAWEGRRAWLNVLVLVVFGGTLLMLLQYFVRGAVIV
jgi:hypothetical protein